MHAGRPCARPKCRAAATLCTFSLPTFVLKAVSAMMASLGRMPTCTCSHEWASNDLCQNTQGAKLWLNASDLSEDGCRAMHAQSGIACAKHEPCMTRANGTQSAMVMHKGERKAQQDNSSVEHQA